MTLAVHLGLATKCKVLLPHALRVVTAEPCLYLVSLILLGCPHSATKVISGSFEFSLFSKANTAF